MSAEIISFPVPLDVQDGPSDAEVLELDAEAVRASKEFELLCREFGLTATGEELPAEDYVPEPDLGSLDDYRVVSGDPEDDYEWTPNE